MKSVEKIAFRVIVKMSFIGIRGKTHSNEIIIEKEEAEEKIKINK